MEVVDVNENEKSNEELTFAPELSNSKIEFASAPIMRPATTAKMSGVNAPYAAVVLLPNVALSGVLVVSRPM